jgi:hypothetical protein
MTPVGAEIVISPAPERTVTGCVTAMKPARTRVLTMTAWTIPR